MRRTFADIVLEKARVNKNIVVVTADLGYKVWDQFREELPDQFINTGAAEQTACGVCVGLALSGKTPIFYSISSFLLRRPFETVKLYIDGEKLPVILAGSGRDKDYAHDGPSHWSEDDRMMLSLLPNVSGFWPDSKEEVGIVTQMLLDHPRPSYINLKR